jgi:hypothetical protein
MSSLSSLIDSFNHADPRFGATSVARIDPIKPQPHLSLVAPLAPKKIEQSNIGSATLGLQVQYDLPKSGYVGSQIIKTYLAATTTDPYTSFAGEGIVSRKEYWADSNPLHLYDNDLILPFYMSQIPSFQAQQLLMDQIGPFVTTDGALSAAQYVITLLPTFHDPLIIPNAEPLQLKRLHKQPHWKITYRTAANCVSKTDSTGAAITSSWLICYMFETTLSMKKDHILNEKHQQFHHSIDFYSVPKKSIATATETAIDCSGAKGLIKKCFVGARLVTEVDTENQYYEFGEIDLIKTDIDGDQDDVFRHKEEGAVDTVIYNRNRSTWVYPHNAANTSGFVAPLYTVPLSYYVDQGEYKHNTGGLHSAMFNKFDLRVQHSLGANAYVSVLVIRSAIYQYSNGTIERLL